MKPSSDNKKRKSIPAHVPPAPERVCIPVRVPDDPEYIALFMGALFELTKQMHYDRDLSHTAKLVAAVWKEIYDATALSVETGETCNDLTLPEAGCIEYQPNAPYFSYAPNDPFQTPNLTPAGYALPAWYTNPLIPLPGVLPGDAMVNFAAIPIGATLPELLTAGFPRVRIPFQGAGEIEIELVRVPQGGIALISMDGSTAELKVIDLNSVSIVGLPALEDILDVVLEPNIAETEVIEWETDTAGAHYIDVTFLPNVGAEVLLGFGGGIRRVSYCGGTEAGSVPMPEFRILNCNLEWRPSNIAAWSNLGNVCGADGEPGQDGMNGASGADAFMPIGAIVPYGGATAPSGWLLCHGQAVSRSTYSALFAVIGVAFGNGNGSTTFNVPDMRQRVPRGIQEVSGGTPVTLAMGTAFGADQVTLVKANLPPHTHTLDSKDSATAFGATARIPKPTSTGTNTSYESGNGTNDGLVSFPVTIAPRMLGTEYIICAESVNGIFAPEFFVLDCTLIWRMNSTAEWVDLVDLTSCTEPGRTPEFRMTAIDVDTQAIEMKYTDQPDLPGAWQTIGYVNDGAQGLPGEAQEQVWRLISESATRRVLQWRFVSDPEIPASYRTVGAWDIPTAEGCDCPSIPAPGDVVNDPDRCQIAWGLANRVSTELIGMVLDFDNNFDWPLDLIEAVPVALHFIPPLGIFLSRLTNVSDFLYDNWNSIPDSADAATYITELGDVDNIREFARVIYAIYDPNYSLTDTHAAIIGATTIAGNIGNRALLGMASWLTAPNIEHWQDAILDAAINDAPQDCSTFTDDPDIVGASFNFSVPSGEIFETGGTYTTTIKLSKTTPGSIGQETRVYYQARGISATNGTDFYLPAGFVTFPATAGNNLTRQLAFSVFDNDLADGDRVLEIKLTEVIGADAIIGQQPKHQVTIHDNEDFYLILAGRGTALERIGEWQWKATATQDANFWRVWLGSMNNDVNRCFRVVDVVFETHVPAEGYYLCGSGGANSGRPSAAQTVHRLDYSTTAGVFNVIVTIEPA